ncbi:NAD-dependent epimerase/dehydratase family protein [Candidatus Pelagibacter communis]|uniref:NAD-dependent epimerase/dehydratase family protein n=1 Tax=Pelagibacter ubique TaxID=198252 RepID=UPI00094DB2CD|nr:NAD-dependent epimerase/dehydratase family protein [Candidatus Pelagibacter ubique]
MKKILITGISGYIGQCLNLYLSKKYKIVGIDKKKIKLKNFYLCDLLNKKKLKKIFEKEKPDIVIHLAALAVIDETKKYSDFYNNNFLVTKNIIEMMKITKTKKIIFASTAAIFKKKKGNIRENDIKKPISNYAKTKFLCEKILNKSGLDVLSFRFFNVCSSMYKFGCGEIHKPETHLIPSVVYKALNNQDVHIFGQDFNTKDGTAVRDYFHVLDLCEALKKGVSYIYGIKGFHTFNIGSGRSTTVLEIISFIKKNYNKNLKIIKIKRRSGDVDRLVCNINNAKKKLKWKPKFSHMKKIISDEVNWVKFLNKKGIKRIFKK